MARRIKPTTLDDQLAELLATFPRLAVRPDGADKHFTGVDELRLLGSLALDDVELTGLPRLDGSYRVKIVVPRAFPATLPRVYAVDASVPASYHTNPDASLCLGASLQLRSIVNPTPTLLGFVVGCVVPYLYRHRHIQVFHKEPWGELDHGAPGLLHHYRSLLGTSDPRACVEFLKLGGDRKRVANKRPCPCRSGLRLGRCHRRRINRLRNLLGRAALRAAERELAKLLDIEARRKAAS